MQFYTQASSDIIQNIEKYKKRNEKVKISLPIEYNSKKYYKIIFLRKHIFKTNEEPEFIFINENKQVIDKVNVQKQLEQLMYYFEIFFDDENSISISKVLKSDDELLRKKKEFEDALKGLEYLSKKKIEGIDEVKSIILELSNLRKIMNEKVKDTIKIIDELKNDKLIFNQKYLDKIYSSYQEALIDNFKIVKIIKKGENYYPKLKKSIGNNKRLYTIVLGGTRVNYINKASYVVNYLSKMLSTYSSVLNLTENQYLKYLKESEKEIINNKIKNIRNKN